jgi:dTDP-4-dehydrorhamnose 3,5-epimerase
MPYTVTRTALPEVLILEPKVFGDERGFFFESFNARDFALATGLECSFVQDNHSKSTQGVLRGLHYQLQQPQGKLVRVTRGEVFDVAVDLRKSSPNFGRWVGEFLSANNKRQVWIPEGFAHGFVVMSDAAELIYKTTTYYAPDYERCVAWNDSSIGVTWPYLGQLTLSMKDQNGSSLQQSECFA